MQLNKQLVRFFEQEQTAHGTKVALFNLLWMKAADDLKAIGVKRVTTVERQPLKRR